MNFEERAKTLVSQMTLEEKISQLRHDAPAIERLGIPAYNWWNEALHGVARAGVATVFPQAIGMAASFDTELLQEVATAISSEARAKYNEYKKFGYTDIYQGLTYWSPNINIFRDPRWGRGQETYGEDPHLSGRMGAAFVKGLQGDGKYRKLDATVKHFAVHSGPEGMRHGFDARVSEEDLRDTYLEAFRYCVENAHPAAVMGAYNRVNGEPACASKTLLEDILYGEWGFDGYVVSDCGAVKDIYENHKCTDSLAKAAAEAINHNCHLNCGDAYLALPEAVESGLVSEETITEAAEKLFTARMRLGMFDEDCEYNAIPYSVVDCDEHRALNRRMARDSIVLLKNDGILPLSANASIAVIGPNADCLDSLLGNYNGTPSRYVTPLNGIRNASDGTVLYARGTHHFKSPSPYEEKGLHEAIIAAQRADVVILCMGLNPSMEGEEGDAFNGANSGDRDTLELPQVQREMIDAVLALKKPTVFVNISGSCINLEREDKSCNAVVQCFYPGAEGGNALADILFGKASPSARLPITFYRSVKDLPPFEDYSMKNRTYRFFKGTPVYPFGHGLTYASVREEWDGDTVRVINESDVETYYTVLFFETGKHKRLLDFKKIRLQAHQTVTVHFES